MLGILNLSLVALLYGCIWLVPVYINNDRRKKGKAPYWIYFGESLVIEIALDYAILYLSKVMEVGILGLYLAPVIAAAVAGWFYLFASRRADNAIKLSSNP